MAVDVKTVPEFALGVSRVLFTTEMAPRSGYTPSADGQRFLLPSVVDGGMSTIVVVLDANWAKPE